MKKLYISLIFLQLFFSVYSQSTTRIVPINISEIRNILLKAPSEINITTAKNQANSAGISIKLPLPNGQNKSFVVVESPLMSTDLAKKYPEIKTYRIFGDNSDGLITVAPSGVYGLIFENEGNVIIAPKINLQNEHEVFFQNDLLNEGECNLTDQHIGTFGKNLRENAIQTYSNGSTLRTYRMAIVTTGEFYVNNGGTETSAQAAVVSIVNSLKAIYEKEASVSFTLVTTKFYTDAATDPFNGANADKAAEVFGALASSEPANFALNTYDIGHVLHGTSGGGVAYLNGPCRNNNVTANPSPIKAGGWSGSTPSSFSTFIHEVGHQFSAGHTFNSVSGSCNGNIMTSSAYEPGSGSTFMSYWGNCTPDNISGSVSRSYFHTNSLQSIINYSISTGNCSVNTPTGNTPPVVLANPNAKTLIIPKGTPFMLEGSGSDADGHTIQYNWEQYNLGTTRGGADEAQNSTTSPIFRSLPPSISGNIRTFPALSTILNGNIPNNDEALPQVGRTITMRLTGRDGNLSGGGVHCASIDITVVNTNPFKITSFNNPNTWVYNGIDNVLLTWDVSGTNTAPINCSNVKVTFSTDGGQTFPITLLASTPNDGSELIAIPNNVTTMGRIKIEAIGNIFFDINDYNITISNSCLKEVSSIIIPSNTVSEIVGSSNLNVNSNALFGLVSPISGTIDSSDPTTNLVAFNQTNSQCIFFSNSPQYDKITFQVTETGTYSFTFTGGTLSSRVLNLYQNSYEIGNLCGNWLTSNANFNGSTVGLSSSLSANLTAGINYVLIISGFGNGNSGTYNINITNNVGGNARYSEPQKTAFQYLVVNENNNIVGFRNNTNLSSYPVGNYKVYVFSFVDNVILSNFINTNFATFQNSISNNTLCGTLSSNFRQINILPDCQVNLNISGLSTSGIQQASENISSSQIINSGVNTTYRAAKSITLQPSAGSGFMAASGSVFRAEIGGCN